MKFHCLTIIFTYSLLMALNAHADEAVGRARATESGQASRFASQGYGMQPASHRCDHPNYQSCDGLNGCGKNSRRCSGKFHTVRCKTGKCSKCKSGCYAGSCKKSKCCLCGYWKNKGDRFCKHCTLYGPAYGWAPPVHVPLDGTSGGSCHNSVTGSQNGFRNGIQYQRYWPSRWYGSPGSSLAYSGAPTVYQPIDTTQFGYYYHHVPTWTARPGMLPSAPLPDAWHRRGCPKGWKPCSHGNCNPDPYANCQYCQPGYPMQGSVIDSSPTPGMMEYSQPTQSTQPMPEQTEPMPPQPNEPQKTIPQTKAPVTLQVPKELQTLPLAPPLISVDEQPLPN